MELNAPILVHWIDLDLLSRLGVAALLGLLLGLDREVRGHEAGFRTHGLICFSAAAMTVSIIASTVRSAAIARIRCASSRRRAPSSGSSARG